MTHILLVEDNPADSELAKEAFSDKAVLQSLSVVEDGEAAIDFILKRGAYVNAQRPDLVLLDLNLPKISGLTVLETIKTNEETASIPVMILSSSKAEKDINEAYRLHANCYLAKPAGLESYFELISTIEKFWLGMVSLPR